MISQVKRYLTLKREAMRLMIAGDVQRYMRALRLMNTLKDKGMAPA
jgi:hypothetical protein